MLGGFFVIYARSRELSLVGRVLEFMSSAPLHDILEDIELLAEREGKIDVRSLLRSFEARSFGPVLILLGVLSMSPLGAVPGIPVVLAAMVILWAGQILIGRSHPWIPKFLHSIEVSEAQITSFVDKADPATDVVDKWVKPRLKWAVGDVSEYVIAGLSIILALLMIPLELVPFAVAIPAGALVLLGLALTAKDGVLTLITIAICAAIVLGSAWSFLG